MRGVCVAQVLRLPFCIMNSASWVKPLWSREPSLVLFFGRTVITDDWLPTLKQQTPATGAVRGIQAIYASERWVAKTRCVLPVRSTDPSYMRGKDNRCWCTRRYDHQVPEDLIFRRSGSAYFATSEVISEMMSTHVSARVVGGNKSTCPGSINDASNEKVGHMLPRT